MNICSIKIVWALFENGVFQWQQTCVENVEAAI